MKAWDKEKPAPNGSLRWAVVWVNCASADHETTTLIWRSGSLEVAAYATQRRRV